MKRFLLVLFGLFIIATQAGADYTYSEGYYFREGVAYSRTQESYQTPYTAYYWNGCVWVGYTAYKTEYRYAYHPVKLPTVKDPDWRSQLTAIAAARDKVEGKIRIAAAEQQNYDATLKSLGLEGNFRWQNYGINPYQAPVLTNASLQLSSAGVNGNTIYGYSSAAESYGSLDLNALFQQSSRLTENAQTLAGQANSEFSGLVGKATDGGARVAESLAKAQAAALALKAAEAAPSSKVETRQFSFKVGPQGQVTDVVPFNPSTKVAGEWIKQSGPLKCIACHTGAEAKGNFDIAQYKATPEEVTRVIHYLTKKNGCPKEGKLSTEELGQFLTR